MLTGSRLADAAAGGLIVLAAGSLAAWLCRQPVRRARLIVLSFLVRLARVHSSTPAVPALGIGDRRSNLYRRVIMLMQDHEPLERRCRAAWSLSAATAAAVVIVVASGLRLGAAPPGADDPVKGAQAVKDAAKPSADAKKVGETLHYEGTVVDKDTGKPIAGGTVVVRRKILRDSLENRVLQETRHTTGADGTYAFEIPADQSATPSLYIELDVEHPDYAPRNGWGYALGMIRKNEKLNERPFFERMEMRPAQPITGRVETPALLEIRAMPTAVIEGRWVDSKGQPGWGWSPLVGGKMDGLSWIAEAHVDLQGRFSVKVPHGLEDAHLTMLTGEHASSRHRIGKDGPLVEASTARLGTLDHDIKDIEIVRYVSPIIVINATTKDGQQIKNFQADVQYTNPRPNRRETIGLMGGGKKKDAIQDEQYDGRYRTYNMLPDKEVTVSVSADGFEEASRKLSLPEAKIKEVTFVLEPKAPKGAGR